jgi:hypothetical protein
MPKCYVGIVVFLAEQSTVADYRRFSEHQPIKWHGAQFTDDSRLLTRSTNLQD